MAKSNKIFGYILISLLILFSITIGLEYYFVKDNHDIEIFTKDLRKQENKIDKLVFLEKKNIENNFFQNLIDKENIVSYFVYQNDSLVYWSNNNKKIPEKYSKFFDKTFLQINDGYYNVRKYFSRQKKVIALIHIYEKYPFENDYLENRFTKYFSQIHKNRVSKTEDKGIPIYTKEGKYVFSLSKGTKLEKDNKLLTFIFILYTFCLFLSLFLFLRKIAFARLKKQIVLLLILSSIIFISRFLLLDNNLPLSFSGLTLFSPHLHASSDRYNSLGDYWLNAAFFLVILFGISLIKVKDIKSSHKNKLIVIIISFLFILLSVSSWYAFMQIESLVINSTFPLQIHTSTINITFYTIWAYSGATMFLAAITSIVDSIVNIFKNNYSTASFYIIWASIATVAISYFLFAYPEYVEKVLFITIIGLLEAFRKNNRRKEINYTTNIIILSLFSIFLTHTINEYSKKKEVRHRNTQASNIIYSNYPLRRIMLETMASEIEKDKTLNMKLSSHTNLSKSEKDIKQYILSKYFNYKWSNYIIDIFYCHENMNINIEEGTKCIDAWAQLHDNNQAIGNSFFYKTVTNNSSDSYIGQIPLKNEKFKDLKLIITLNRKPYEDGLGYSELLLNSKANENTLDKDYAFAKYINNNLQWDKGQFNYNKKFNILKQQTNKHGFFELQGYNHYIHSVSDDYKIVISQESSSLYKKYNALPYIFILFFILTALAFLVEGNISNRIHFDFFQQKIKIFFIGMLILVFAIFGFISIFYTYNTNRNRYTKEHKSKIRKIRKKFFSDIKSLSDLENSIYGKNNFSQRLKQSAKLIDADINIYNKQGNLIATSQPEIFKENIISKRMNKQAMFALNRKEITEITMREKIGKLVYSSVYITIWNNKNQAIAYLNIPFFLNYKEFRSELQTITITLLSISLFVIIIVITIAYIISQQITKSLTYLRERFLNIQLSQKNAAIIYEKEDEIAPLITAYNQMVTKIEKQSQELAQNEKEKAWREMARQVAHEIRNPLTPMKINIQFLQRQLAQKKENWENNFTRISNSLIEEIDSLAETASTFSDFAKISEAKKKCIDLVPLFQDLSVLFSQERISLYLEIKTPQAPILGDKMQIRRAFINIISNGIQAIYKKELSEEFRNEDGEIKISIKEKNNLIKIYIKDNGPGIQKEIQEKIFTPNFTTKNSGMGLGLAITKEIIEQSNGTIQFKTTIDKGTIFIIHFPMCKLS